MVLDNIILFVGIGIFINRCVAKKKLLDNLDNREDIILKIIVFVGMVYLIIKFVMPTILDVPYCLREDFLIIEGIAQHNAGRNVLDKEVKVLDEENQKMVRVVFPYKPGIKKGDKIRVQYVPHSGYGRLLEINGEIIHEIE